MFGRPLGNPLVWHSELSNTKEFEEVYRQKYWGAMGHQRVLTPRALKELFIQRGFIIEQFFTGGYGLFFGFMQSFLSRLDRTHSQLIGLKIRKKTA